MPGEVHTVTTQSRLPHVEAKAWAYVLEAGVFGYDQIEAELSVSENTARELVQKWLSEGRIRKSRGWGRSGQAQYELTVAYREPKDHASQVAAQLWTAMHGLKSFSPMDLTSHCRPDVGVTKLDASRYAQALLKAGYLKVRRVATPGVREAIYVLVRYTGPRAPMEKRVAAIWDPNDGAYAYVAGAGRMGGAK